MPDTALWVFSALDTLFFRDGQPMNAGESAWIDSRFPPSGLTLQGAIRAAVLDHRQADVQAFQRGEPCLPNGESLKDAIGDAESIGNMRLTGPFLHRDGELWVPVPLDLVQVAEGKYELLRPAEPVHCDLGHIRLPHAESGGGRSLTGCYMKASALAQLLRGEASFLLDEFLPLLAKGRDTPGLVDREPKIGLARDNRTRTHSQSMLYSIAPIRPRSGVELWVKVEGIKSDWYPSSPFPVLLGGEKRTARVDVTEGRDFDWPAPSLGEEKGRIRFKMVFLTPARFGEEAWPLGEARKRQRGGIDCWQVRVGNTKFDIVSAVVGKPERLGGWNLKERRSRALRSYLPAGSVFFCEADPSQQDAIQGMHDTKIGDMTEYGFGHVLIGQW